MEGKVFAACFMALVLVPVFSATAAETDIAHEMVLDRIDLNPGDIAMSRLDEKDIDVKGVGAAPFMPHISGPTSGLMSKTYEYAVVSTDPQGDDVFYRIVWGDCGITWWDGPYESGEVVMFSHSWCEVCCPGGGTFTIYVQAKDVDDHVSVSAEYQVVMKDSRVKASGGTPFKKIIGRILDGGFVEASGGTPFKKIIGRILRCFPALEDVTDGLVSPDDGSLPDFKQLRKINFGPDGLDEDEKVSRDPSTLVSQVPFIASFDGERVGMFDRSYEFVFSVVDHQGDDVFLEIDWGDGAATEAGPYSSGESVSFTHVWSEFSPHAPRFMYEVGVRVSDDTGVTSGITVFKVTMVSTNLQLVFYRSLELLAGRFPVLESMFGFL